MKTIAFFVAAVAASTNAVAAWSTATCPWTEYLKLAPLANSQNLKPCQDASGWNMIPPSGEPTADQRAKMCKTPACFALMTEVKAVNPSDCVLVFGNAQLNVKQLVEEFKGKCPST